MLGNSLSEFQSWSIINLDNQTPEMDHQTYIDEYIFNLCVFKSQNNTEVFQRLFNHPHWDPRFFNLFIITDSASTNDDISTFFQFIWKHYVLNAALMYWSNGNVVIYTHFPYQGNFHQKVFESHHSNGTNIKIPHNLFQTLFSNKSHDLNNTEVSVFLFNVLPNIVQIPRKYQIGRNYYFGGLDGYLANFIENQINGRWLYKVYGYDKTFEFNQIYDENNFFKDFLGNIYSSNTSFPPNVNYLELPRNSSLT